MDLACTAIRAHTPTPTRNSLGDAPTLELIETIVDDFGCVRLHIRVLKNLRTFGTSEPVISVDVKLCGDPSFETSLAGTDGMIAVVGDLFRKRGSCQLTIASSTFKLGGLL